MIDLLILPSFKIVVETKNNHMFKALIIRSLLVLCFLILIPSRLLNAQFEGKNTQELNPVEPVQVSRKDFQASPEYAANLKIALSYQYKSDSLYRAAREARIKTKAIPDPDERWKIQSKIITWEKLSADYQAKADEYYSIVRKLETRNTESNEVPSVIKKDTTINELTIYKFTSIPDIRGDQSKKSDTTIQVDKAPGGKKSDAIVKPATGKSEGVIQFDILDKSPYSAKNPFPVNIKIPPGAFYRIQLGVFNKKLEWDAFGGLNPITSETIPGKPMMRYYVGHFTSLERAKTVLTIVKSKGFKESFIAAWYNGQKLAPEKVRDFEKRDRK